jgi:hypothetical protein
VEALPQRRGDPARPGLQACSNTLLPKDELIDAGNNSDHDGDYNNFYRLSDINIY